jgi:hypothetical protein
MSDTVGDTHKLFEEEEMAKFSGATFKSHQDLEAVDLICLSQEVANRSVK